MAKCTICNGINPPYKCPKCRSPYCSVKCYKCHECVPCAKIEDKPKQSCDNSEKCAEYSYVTEDTVPVEKLRLLENCEELKSILDNPHVRDILREIDNSSDPSGMMDRAMKEPIFVEFADACLKAIGENGE